MTRLLWVLLLLTGCEVDKSPEEELMPSKLDLTQYEAVVYESIAQADWRSACELSTGIIQYAVVTRNNEKLIQFIPIRDKTCLLYINEKSVIIKS